MKWNVTDMAEKPLQFETDTVGEPVVNHIDGKFTEDYYYYTEATGNTDFKVWAELFEHFDEADALQHVYFIAIDLSYETLNEGRACGLAGVTFFPSGGGYAIIFFWCRCNETQRLDRRGRSSWRFSHNPRVW